MNRVLERRKRITPCRVAFSVCVGLFCVSAANAADDVFPRELTSFVQLTDGPIFKGAGGGHWDVKIRERGWIYFDKNARQGKPAWHLWYTGYDGTREGQKKLGYATSNDGKRWLRHPDNPLSSQHWIEDMIVVRKDGTFYMFAEGKGDQAQLLTSQDGVAWKRVGALDVRLKNGTPIEPGPYGTPVAWYENNTWHLFYERGDLGVWLATSRDMKVWTNVQDEPVMKPGPGEHEKDLIAMNQIVKHNGKYYAYYHGSKRGSKLWCTNVAVSDDLIHWTKYSKNPLFPLKTNKSSGIMVHDGDQFRLYTMHDRVDLHFPKTKK
jgi:beta-1,2-mannobiose phosphorylase / 1,2-beta-oligomannan phosphorylase